MCVLVSVIVLTGGSTNLCKNTVTDSPGYPFHEIVRKLTMFVSDKHTMTNSWLTTVVAQRWLWKRIHVD